MLSHLNSVTGAPVCHYSEFSWQPLNGEFNKTPPMPRTNRQLSEGEDTCILFRIVAFMITHYITRFRLCQVEFKKYFQSRLDKMQHKISTKTRTVSIENLDSDHQDHSLD